MPKQYHGTLPMGSCHLVIMSIVLSLDWTKQKITIIINQLRNQESKPETNVKIQITVTEATTQAGYESYDLV